MNKKVIDRIREVRSFPKSYSDEWIEEQYKGSMIAASAELHVATQELIKRIENALESH